MRWGTGEGGGGGLEEEVWLGITTTETKSSVALCCH